MIDTIDSTLRAIGAFEEETYAEWHEAELLRTAYRIPK
jgi:hypothetical protein